MILTETKNPKIKFGNGDVFAKEEYGAEALIVFSVCGFNPLNSDAMFHRGEPGYIHHRFRGANQSPRNIHFLIWRYLRKHAEAGYKRIGIHCSTHIDDSAVAGARVAYEAVQSWVKKHGDLIDCITMVDLHGDYARFLND